MPPETPLTFEKILDDLRALLSSEIKDGERFARWLSMLGSDIYGKVLGVNLYLDLRNGCLDASVIANIIDNIPFPEKAARRAFFEYVEKHQDEVLFRHRDGPQRLEDDQYVRILHIADMITFYLHDPMGLSDLILEAQQEVVERFFELPEERRERLGVVTAIWRGSMSNVWVTTLKTLQTVQSSIADDSACNLADTIRDRLGLNGLDNGKLVYIVYPSTHDQARTYVPTTLDSHFGSICYLSAKAKNEWGQTHCLNAKSEGVIERVHEPFVGLTDEFEMKPLDDITTESLLDLDHLMNAALKRV